MILKMSNNFRLTFERETELLIGDFQTYVEEFCLKETLAQSFKKTHPNKTKVSFSLLFKSAVIA